MSPRTEEAAIASLSDDSKALYRLMQSLLDSKLNPVIERINTIEQVVNTTSTDLTRLRENTPAPESQNTNNSKHDETIRRQLGKFNPQDNRTAIIATDKGSTYHDVTLFVANLRRNQPPARLIPDTLAGAAISWFMGELLQDERDELDSLQAWIEALNSRFKLPYQQAVQLLHTTRYISNSGQPLAEYAAIIARLCRNVNDLATDQFIITNILSGLPPSIQHWFDHVDPTDNVPLSYFVKELRRKQANFYRNTITSYATNTNGEQELGIEPAGVTHNRGGFGQNNGSSSNPASHHAGNIRPSTNGGMNNNRYNSNPNRPAPAPVLGIVSRPRYQPAYFGSMDDDEALEAHDRQQDEKYMGSQQ